MVCSRLRFVSDPSFASIIAVRSGAGKACRLSPPAPGVGHLPPMATAKGNGEWRRKHLREDLLVGLFSREAAREIGPKR